MTDIYVFDNENALTSKFFQSVKKLYPSFESMAFSKKLVIVVPLHMSLDNEKFSKAFINAHLFQPSAYYRDQYQSFTGKQAEIKSDFLLIHKQGCDDSSIERSCQIIEDNEVYNDRDSHQSYRLLLIDKPVEGKFHPINSSQIGLRALYRKSIPEILRYVTSCSDSHVLQELNYDLYYLTSGYQHDDNKSSLLSRISNCIETHTESFSHLPEWNCVNTTGEKIQILRTCIECYVLEKTFDLSFRLECDSCSKDDSLLQNYVSTIQSQGGFTPAEISLKPLLYIPSSLESLTIHSTFLRSFPIAFMQLTVTSQKPFQIKPILILISLQTTLFL